MNDYCVNRVADPFLLASTKRTNFAVPYLHITKMNNLLRIMCYLDR